MSGADAGEVGVEVDAVGLAGVVEVEAGGLADGVPALAEEDAQGEAVALPVHLRAVLGVGARGEELEEVGAVVLEAGDAVGGQA